jgi:hypothetical protein
LTLSITWTTTRNFPVTFRLVLLLRARCDRGFIMLYKSNIHKMSESVLPVIQLHSLKHVQRHKSIWCHQCV